MCGYSSAFGSRIKSTSFPLRRAVCTRCHKKDQTGYPFPDVAHARLSAPNPGSRRLLITGLLVRFQRGAIPQREGLTTNPGTHQIVQSQHLVSTLRVPAGKNSQVFCIMTVPPSARLPRSGSLILPAAARPELASGPARPLSSSHHPRLKTVTRSPPNAAFLATHSSFLSLASRLARTHKSWL